MKIYTVEGSTGEYDDYTSWIVKSFRSLTKAESFVVKANLECQAMFAARISKYSYDSEEHSMDPHYRTDYTGTSYGYFATELEE